MPDICANESLDAIAKVCNLHVVTYRFESGGYPVVAIALGNNLEQFTIDCDDLMTAVIKIGEWQGIDWSDI